MSSGPQKYPGASTRYWYQGTYPGDGMEVNVVAWHTTEGTSVPTYSGGAQAPNLTVSPDFKNKKLVWYQHFDIDRSSRALMNLTGGVQTNTLNVVQVEIVGTCDPKTHAKWTKAGYDHLYSADLPQWAIDGLAEFAQWLYKNHKVPLTENVTFKAYDASYGASNGVRMSGAKWETYTGHCGHQHVPENLHGDPGAFPIDVILAKARTGTATTPTVPGTGTGAVKPKVSLKNVIAAAKADPGRPQGSGLHEADTRLVEKALAKLGYLDKAYASDGAWGTLTLKAYSRWQKAYSDAHHLGWTGDDLDGRPGISSLKALASKTGLFQVVS